MGGDLREGVLDLLSDLEVQVQRWDAAEAIGWVAVTIDPECDGKITQVTGLFATEVEAATWLDGHLLRANTGNGADEQPFTGEVRPVFGVDE